MPRTKPQPRPNAQRGGREGGPPRDGDNVRRTSRGSASAGDRQPPKPAGGSSGDSGGGGNSATAGPGGSSRGGGGGRGKRGRSSMGIGNGAPMIKGGYKSSGPAASTSLVPLPQIVLPPEDLAPHSQIVVFSPPSLDEIGLGVDMEIH
ncbi:hypothetical protein HK104_009117, partial [Borealophlyctis nickersoniae]